MEIRHITVDEFFAHPDAGSLLAEYAEESRIDGLPAPDPDRDMYRRLEATGVFAVVAAFRGDALIGVATLLVSPNPHYSAVIGVTESLFVRRGYRDTGAGMALIHLVKDSAKEAGAAGFLMSAPIGGQLAKVLERMDCRETNRVFFWSFA